MDKLTGAEAYAAIQKEMQDKDNIETAICTIQMKGDGAVFYCSGKMDKLMTLLVMAAEGDPVMKNAVLHAASYLRLSAADRVPRM